MCERCVKPWAHINWFLSASDHRCEGSLAVVALVLVLYQLSLISVDLVVGFLKENLQEGKLCVHSLGTQRLLLTAGRGGDR